MRSGNATLPITILTGGNFTQYDFDGENWMSRDLPDTPIVGRAEVASNR